MGKFGEITVSSIPSHSFQHGTSRIDAKWYSGIFRKCERDPSSLISTLIIPSRRDFNRLIPESHGKYAELEPGVFYVSRLRWSCCSSESIQSDMWI